MLGRVGQQRGFSDILLWMQPGVVSELERSFYGALRKFGEELLGGDLFAAMYASGVGRPSVPPIILAKAVLLEMHDGVSDREAEQHAKFDLRWRYALDLDVDDKVFDASTLCRFRARLLVHEQERSAFERFVTAAQAAGLLSRRQIMDSTAVHGAGAVQDTYQLIRGAIRKLRKKAGRVAGLASRLDAVLQRADYGKTGKPDIDWQDVKARQDLLNEIVRDRRAAVVATRDLLAAGKEDASVAEAADLLARVVEQDIEPIEGGDEVCIRQGVAKDRVVSITDPEMRHGHKTSSGRFDGAKVNATMDEDAQLITDVGVLKGNEADGDAVMPALEREEKLGVQPQGLMGDHAYGIMGLRPQIAAKGIELTAPLAAPSAPAGRFGKDDFTIDLDAPQCNCPNGALGKPQYARMPDGTRILGGFQFRAQDCGACPLKDRCTPAAARSVGIQPDERERRELRQQQKTQAFLDRYHRRPLVERCIAELAMHGIHQARYVGNRKLALQAAFTALVVNIKRAAKAGTLPKVAAATG